MNNQELINELEQKLEDLYSEFISTEKKSQINTILHEIEITREKISKLSNNNNVIIPCIIIFTEKHEKIKKNYPEDVNNCFEERYDNDLLENWKPFKDGSKIKEILSSFNENSKFIFETKYLASDYKTNDEVYIDQNLNKIIAIIDVIAVNEDNKIFVKKFDTTHVGYVITPICSFLEGVVKNDAFQKKENCFTTLGFYLKQGEGYFKFDETNSEVLFYNRLKYAFREIFKKNDTKTILGSDRNIKF